MECLRSPRRRFDTLRKAVRITTLVIALALLLAALPVLAQEGTGTITGQLTDSEGTPVAGARVEVVGQAASQTTDRNGRFTISGVPAGTYTLQFTLSGQTASLEGVEVVAGETTTIGKSVDWQLSFAESITVYSAAREVQRVVDAPAAVTVVTQESIEREASHGLLPKLLEFTPGVDITTNSVYGYNLNTRGFNTALNRRVTVRIDGRDPTSPFVGAPSWLITRPLDDLAAVEFVRGPSAALYGANASSGVVNLITKAPRNSPGGVVRLTGGELSTFNADLRWAGQLGESWFGKVTGGTRNSDGFAVSRVDQVEYSEPCAPGVIGGCLPLEVVPLNPVDDIEISVGSARLDKYFGRDRLLLLEGGIASVEGTVTQSGIARVQVVEAERPWARVNFSTNHWNLLGAYTGRDAPRQTSLATGTNIPLEAKRIAFEGQTHWGLAGGRGRIVVGASHKKEEADSSDPETGRQTLLFAPVEADFNAVFGQFDWNLTDALQLVVAARYDESDLFDGQFSPKGALVWGVNASNTLRLTYNEAFQVPNFGEIFLAAPALPPINLSPFEAFCAPFGISCGFNPDGNLATPDTRVLALGNENLKFEEVTTIEVGYSGILNDEVFVTLDYYNSQNTNFITDLLPRLGTPLGLINPNIPPYQPPAALPAPVQAALLAALQDALGPSFFILSNAPDGTPILAAASNTNFGEVDTQGVDLAVNLYPTSRWRVGFTYSWFDFELGNSNPLATRLLLPNTPENKASGSIAYIAPTWDVELAARWVDDFRWSVGPTVGPVRSYTTADLVGNWRASEHFALGVNVSNVFDNEHWEAFGGSIIRRRALASVEVRW